MQIFVNLISRAFFMSTPLILGALGEVLAERTGLLERGEVLLELIYPATCWWDFWRR